MIFIMNGTDGDLVVGKNTVGPGSISSDIPLRTKVSTVGGSRVNLKDIDKTLGTSHATWMEKNGLSFFDVRAPSGNRAFYVTQSLVAGQPVGLYISPQGYMYFNKSDGGTVPKGFASMSASSADKPAAAPASAAPVLPPTPAPPVPFSSPAPNPSYLEQKFCPPERMELAGLNRLMGSVRLSQAQGDILPVRIIPKDPSMPTRVEFSAAIATAKPPGLASLTRHGECTGMTPAQALAAQGETLVAAPLRPQDVLETYASEGARYRGGMVMHPRGGVPHTTGPTTLNLTPQSEWLTCRKENVERINYMMDRLADLQIAAMNSESPL